MYVSRTIECYLMVVCFDVNVKYTKSLLHRHTNQLKNHNENIKLKQYINKILAA